MTRTIAQHADRAQKDDSSNVRGHRRFRDADRRFDVCALVLGVWIGRRLVQDVRAGRQVNDALVTGEQRGQRIVTLEIAGFDPAFLLAPGGRASNRTTDFMLVSLEPGTKMLPDKTIGTGYQNSHALFLLRPHTRAVRRRASLPNALRSPGR